MGGGRAKPRRPVLPWLLLLASLLAAADVLGAEPVNVPREEDRIVAEIAGGGAGNRFTIEGMKSGGRRRGELNLVKRRAFFLSVGTEPRSYRFFPRDMVRSSRIAASQKGETSCT